MNKILTVIVPVYNMETYLRRCLDSLIVSEDLMKQIEIIVINDGSIDNSLSIMNEYGKKYPDSFLIINKENGGHGSAWNIGLKLAKGKYLRFLDSDDWFDTNVFTEYIKELMISSADLLITKYVQEDMETNEQKILGHNIEYGKDFNLSEIGDGNQFNSFALHVSTYKTDNLRKCGAHFREKVSYDDCPINIFALCFTKKISSRDFKLLHYLRGREGQSMDKAVIKKKFPQMLMSLQDSCDAYKKCCDFIDPQLKELAKRQVGLLFDLFSRIAQEDLPTSEWIYYIYQIRKISLSLPFINEKSKEMKAWNRYPFWPYAIYRIIRRSHK